MVGFHGSSLEYIKYLKDLRFLYICRKFQGSLGFFTSMRYFVRTNEKIKP